MCLRQELGREADLDLELHQCLHLADCYPTALSLRAGAPER